MKSNGHNDNRNALGNLLPQLAAFIGVFTLAAYFLGRVHLEMYYNFLGIAPSSLTFRVDEYMFNSTDLVVLIAVFLFSGFLVTRERPKLEGRRSRIAWAIMGVLFLVVGIMVIARLQGWPLLVFPVKGLWGLFAGAAVAGACLVVRALQRPGGLLWLYISFLGFIGLSLGVVFLSHQERLRDVGSAKGLPVATVSYVGDSPDGRESGVTARKTGRVITINNGVLYIWSDSKGKAVGIPLNLVRYIDYGPVSQ